MICLYHLGVDFEMIMPSKNPPLSDPSFFGATLSCVGQQGDEEGRRQEECVCVVVVQCGGLYLSLRVPAANTLEAEGSRPASPQRLESSRGNKEVYRYSDS
jgi:hypothetical protein